jgi:hypothetical protein
LRMELAVKAQPFLVSSMRIAVSGNAGVEGAALADGVMDGVLVPACDELVTVAWGDDMEPVVLHAPSSSARAGKSNRGNHVTCVGFLRIFLSPISSSSFGRTHVLSTHCACPGLVGKTIHCQEGHHKRLAAEQHSERSDHQRILGQDNIVFCHSKAVHIGYLLRGNGA